MIDNSYYNLMGIKPVENDPFNPQAVHPVQTLAGGTMAPNPNQNMSYDTTNGQAPQAMSFNTPNGAVPDMNPNPEVRPEQFGLPADLDTSPTEKGTNWAAILAGGAKGASKALATAPVDLYGKSLYGSALTPYRHPV